MIELFKASWTSVEPNLSWKASFPPAPPECYSPLYNAQRMDVRQMSDQIVFLFLWHGSGRWSVPRVGAWPAPLLQSTAFGQSGGQSPIYLLLYRRRVLRSRLHKRTTAKNPNRFFLTFKNNLPIICRFFRWLLLSMSTKQKNALNV